MDSITQEFLECTIDLIDSNYWNQFFHFLFEYDGLFREHTIRIINALKKADIIWDEKAREEETIKALTAYIKDLSIDHKSFNIYDLFDAEELNTWAGYTVDELEKILVNNLSKLNLKYSHGTFIIL